MQAHVLDRKYLRLLALILLTAIPVALLALAYLALIHRGIEWLWVALPERLFPGLDRRVYTVALSVSLGLLVGLTTRYLGGQHQGKSLQRELLEDGRTEYRGLPAYLLGALLSLWSGASLGPEVSLAHMAGGIGTWVSERRGLPLHEKRVFALSEISVVFANLFGSAFTGAFMATEFSGLLALPIYYHLVAATAAGAVGMAVGALLDLTGIAGIYDYGAYESLAAVHMVFAVALGLFGVVSSFVFKVVMTTARSLFQPLLSWPVLMPVIGAAIFGLIGAFVPITLFSGEVEMIELLETGTELGALFLIGLALLKVITLAVSMSSGFTGGFIFPLLFAAAALGMAVHETLPAIPLTVAVVCTVAGVAGAVMRMPFAVILLLTVLTGPAVGPLITVAAITAYLAVLTLPRTGNARAELARSEEGAAHQP